MAIRIILEKQGSIPKKQTKTAVLVVGRFQSPHKGHALLVNAAKKAFRKYGYDAIIICVIEGKETSKNKQVNPLSGKSRVFYLKNSKFGKDLKYIVAGSAFDAFIKTRELGYEPMCVVGGKFISGDKEENRAEGYKAILDKYFRNNDDSPINHRAVVLERDPDSSGTAGISGSTVRSAVLADRYEDFEDMTELNSNELTRQMFDELKSKLKGKE